MCIGLWRASSELRAGFLDVWILLGRLRLAGRRPCLGEFRSSSGSSEFPGCNCSTSRAEDNRDMFWHRSCLESVLLRFTFVLAPVAEQLVLIMWDLPVMRPKPESVANGGPSARSRLSTMSFRDPYRRLYRSRQSCADVRAVSSADRCRSWNPCTPACE